MRLGSRLKCGRPQAVIGEIEAQRNDLDYDLDGAVLRLADRNAYAAAGTRASNSGYSTFSSTVSTGRRLKF